MAPVREELFTNDLGEIERQGFLIPSSHVEGLKLFLRQVAPKEPTGGRPVLFVHGAILASYFFDIALEGYSWMEHIARKGCPVFALDIRGYGASDKPPAMDDAVENSPPIAGSAEALQDIDDAVEFIRSVAGCE